MESRGTVSAAEFADLQTIAANLENGIATPDYVSSIFYQLVDGSGANARWTGGLTTSTALGDLKAGTTSTQLTELIGKWFLGTDLPDSTVPGADTSSGKPVDTTYIAYNYALFGSTGSPQISDIAQGSIGDCELCAGIIETLENHPGLISSMFVNDGNGVYGVRFYINGTETWVTVNSELPTYNNHLAFNNAYVATPSNGLWVDLIEKAYAQLSSTGQIDHPATNSYANIEADFAFDVLTNLTNASSVQYFQSTDVNWNAYKSIIINAVNQHDDVVLETGDNVAGTFDSAGNQLLVSNHAYAVIGYDSATGDFIVRNPWGDESGSQNFIPQFEVSMSDIASSAVQGDFVLDNSAAPNVVFTAAQLSFGLTDLTYSSFQQREATLGAHITVSLAPLFQVQDLAGQAVTQYMFQLMGTGASINLNGATNSASAAQQAAGEIVVSAADLSKLTLTTGAVGSAIELYLSGNDGSGFSAPIPVNWTIDSQGITLLPVTNPLAAPSSTVSIASLFQLAGSTSGSLTYTIAMDAGLGSFNLNGATNLLSGSTTKIEVSAADLAKVTYTAPVTSGIAVLDIGVGSTTQASDLTQVEIDVGYSVATALSDFKSGTVPYQIGVADSAATIFANLDSLETMMPNWNLLGVLVDDATKQTETVSVTQFIADQGVLSITSGNFALDVSGVTLAQAQSLLGNSSNTVAAVQISDSAADIFAGLNALESMATAGQIASITLTDANKAAETLTTTQLSADSSVLNDISGAYSLTISGSAASVAADLTLLQSLAAKGALAAVTLTDSGTPNLSITAAQLSADADVLSDISGSYTLTVSAGSSAVTVAGVAGHATTVEFTGNAGLYGVSTANGAVSVATSGGFIDHLSGIAAIQFADVTAIVAATPGSASAVTTGNVTELYAAVLDREPDVGGLTYYQNFLLSNPSTGLQTFADYFLNSTEYKSAHTYASGTAGDTQFIIDSYQNLLNRTPSTDEVNFYLTNVMTKPDAHALMLVYFSASTEFLKDVQVTAANPVSAQHWLILT